VSSPSPSSHRTREELGFLLPPFRTGGLGSGLCIGLERCRALRAHRVGLEEFLEEWFERSAETCDIFDNISEVDKYSLTCTVCRHFEHPCCAPDKGPSMVALLKASFEHDAAAWEPTGNGGPKRHQHAL
jgi:hypothetical protein